MPSRTLQKLGLLGAILLAELLAITTWLDGAALAGRTGMVGQIGASGAWVLRFVVGFAAAFAAFVALRGDFRVERAFPPVRFRSTWLLLHVVVAAAFALLSAQLYGAPTAIPDLLAAAWLVAGSVTLVVLCLAFYPLKIWTGLATESNAALHAAGVAGAGVLAVRLSQSMWQSAALLTFQMVQVLVRPVLPDLLVQPEQMRLQGHSFGVIISEECSGLEGVGLVVAFGAVWLWLNRTEFRFPRALLLLPAGMLVIYALNAVRIALLLLLGDAGAPNVAAGGFHSQAGWICFNGVALGMTLVVPRMGWFSLHPRQAEQATYNPTAPYLMPFLAILASGMFTRAASADFDWLYAARLVAALAALWWYREPLLKLDWRFGWAGVLAGAAVFAVWLGLDQWLALPAAAMPAALGSAGDGLRWAWISTRALAAITTVPIAEELVFRGYAMRRWSGAEFDALPLRSSTLAGVAGSSVVFGMLHGDRWIAGILAGFAFAWVARSRDRIGEAVAAHAVANVLLAVWVLYFNQWQYW